MNITEICEAFCFLLILGVAAFNIKTATLPVFLKVNVAQLITPLIALVIAFWATQYKTDQRKAKEHAERIIISIQSIVTSESFSAIPNNNEKENIICREMNARNRKLSNYMRILEAYSKELNFKDEWQYISIQFNEYKTIIGEHPTDFQYLAATEPQFKRIADNIDSKCEAIILKFYK